MSIWKQAAIGLVLLGLGFVAWARFAPGSGETLARWGLDWLPFAATVAESSPASGPANAPRGQGAARQAVIAAVVSRETINDRLTAIGTGRARQSVVVTPYSSGRMTEVLVSSGATVKAGEALARLDAEVETIAVDRARIALDDAVARQERVAALRSSNTASAVQVKEAALAVDNARLALRDAELALDRRTITAPISGIVGILPVTAGNYVTTTTEIARIDDRSDILIDFWVPERFATVIEVGMELTASSVARPGEVFGGQVSAIDNRVDEKSRTLQVQASIRNDDDRLRAGMSFQVTMRFPGDTFPSVDPLAIQWGADGAFVWVVRDGKAERTPVRIVQRNTETVLVDAPIGEGEVVVTEGIHAVRQGAEVRIARTERAPGTGATPPASGT